jgi:putative transposase
MRASRFSEEQIIHLLQQAERGEQAIGVLCREHGISEQTFYRWRKQFGGMTVSDAQRLRELEKENARLKRLLAERDLEVDALRVLLAKKWLCQLIAGHHGYQARGGMMASGLDAYAVVGRVVSSCQVSNLRCIS